MKTIRVGDVVGDYTVIDVAGAGGMGTVYKIEHVITKRIEAMKGLPPSLSSDPEQVRRFEREIQVQARLHHPNIVALYNAIRDGDSIALVMEYVEGESLQRRIDAGPMPLHVALDFAIQVLGALAYAHAAGVIHRDVSPANIIITADGVAKLTDFGLARGATDMRLSTSGAPLGSPWYMSPEQVKGGHELDTRADVYSMGAVLHEMLTGRKLFEAEGAFEVMRAHVETEPRPPSALRPEIPVALDEIVLKAVAKDPAMRFQSAEEFSVAVQCFSGAFSERAGDRSNSAFPAWSSRFRLASKRDIRLLTLVPVALAAGFFAVRVSPVGIRTPVKQNSSTRVEAVSNPAPWPAAPVAATPVETPLQDVVATSPALTAPMPEETVIEHPRMPTVAKPTRQASTTARSTALRVTGESSPPAAFPPPRRDPPHPVEAAETVAPKTSPVEAPVASPPIAAGAPTPAPGKSDSTAETEATPANSQTTGNRLVRALGKVNPLRLLNKHDTPKTPPNDPKNPLKQN